MGKKVIVIDDSQTVRQQVALALTPGGFEVIEAVDGIDGIAVISRTPDAGLIICDLNMPRMDGLKMLEAVRTDSKYANIPIVMLTTEGQPQLIERAKKAGASGWSVTPF